MKAVGGSNEDKTIDLEISNQYLYHNQERRDFLNPEEPRPAYHDRKDFHSD